MDATVPLRVDFAGGWLDVPKLARPGAYIVNCTIEPFNSRHGGGVGGSARAAILSGQDPFVTESKIAGWQDAAVLTETGLCVWRSGPTPVLEAKYNPDFLRGKIAVLWTGKPHDTVSLVGKARDYSLIKRAGYEAAPGISIDQIAYLRYGMELSYRAQIAEGMEDLPFPGEARKYLGSGWGGYALYLFDTEPERARWLAEARRKHEVLPVEPYMRGYGGYSNG